MGFYKDLLAFKKAYELAMEIFNLSKRFPPEEKYSLTDQIIPVQLEKYTDRYL